MVHRYPRRVLFLVSNTCAALCRFCTRKRMVSQPSGSVHKDEIEASIDYIASNKHIEDVLLSGGDPLTFVTSQTLRKVIRKIKDTSGRPIWTPSYEAGIVGSFTDEVLGYPLKINNDMPAPAANAKSLTFGAHGKYLIRDAMVVSMFRFDDSAYMSKGQVGYLAWSRAGGNLLDSAAVKAYQHSAT